MCSYRIWWHSPQKRAKMPICQYPERGSEVSYVISSFGQVFIASPLVFPRYQTVFLARVRPKPETAHEKPLLLVIRLGPWARDVASVQIPLPFSDFSWGEGGGSLYTGYLRTGMTWNMSHGNFGRRKLFFFFKLIQNYFHKRRWITDAPSPIFPEGRGVLYTGYKDEANKGGFCCTREKNVWYLG